MVHVLITIFLDLGDFVIIEMAIVFERIRAVIRGVSRRAAIHLERAHTRFNRVETIIGFENERDVGALARLDDALADREQFLGRNVSATPHNGRADVIVVTVRVVPNPQAILICFHNLVGPHGGVNAMRNVVALVTFHALVGQHEKVRHDLAVKNNLFFVHFTCTP